MDEIPPKSEWNNLTITQLYDVKTLMSNRYYSMRGINASFSSVYLRFAHEVDAVIRRKELESQAEE